MLQKVAAATLFSDISYAEHGSPLLMLYVWFALHWSLILSIIVLSTVSLEGRGPLQYY
jgi:hypothetical protein